MLGTVGIGIVGGGTTDMDPDEIGTATVAVAIGTADPIIGIVPGYVPPISGSSTTSKACPSSAS